mmetsp:Transcript_2264/g.7546  ORF Transcript_2264/g.7546 Transcript_2264/m.7546 type:complete len:253 (+) Transcript_2264:758-1516(+)
MAGRTVANQPDGAASSTAPRKTGPGLRPSSSYAAPLMGTYAMKWYTSSSSVAFLLSSWKGSGRANELWAVRMAWLSERAAPLRSAGKAPVNSRNSDSDGPSDRCGLWQFMRTEMMACVAHAFWITCLAKKMPCSSGASTVSRVSSRSTHLKRKMQPNTSPSAAMPSSLMSHTSSTCTPLHPNDSMSSVNTPGSDSMVHHPPDMAARAARGSRRRRHCARAFGGRSRRQMHSQPRAATPTARREHYGGSTCDP